MDRTGPEIPDAGIVLATALYLATNYAKLGCPMLPRMIVRQLACLEGHPDPAVPAALRDISRKLRYEWERIGRERAQTPSEVRAGSGGADRGQMH
jgi:hypothetical protein